MARSDIDGKTLAVWRVRWHEVFSWINQPGVSGAQALRRFERRRARPDFRDGPNVLSFGGRRVSPPAGREHAWRLNPIS